MAETDIRQVSTSSLNSASLDFSVKSKQLDSPSDTKENYWYNQNWSKYLGYYKTIPELKKAIDGLSMWTVGKGWNADDRTTIILNLITGWGEDSFQSILTNMLNVKKINGDAYAEIIRVDGILANLKPISPANIRIVVDNNGIIIGYDLMNSSKTPYKRLKPSDVFHLSNDRLGDEIHGVSVVEACEQVILMRNEAMNDWRKVLHRNINPLKIFEVDTDDPTKINTLKSNYTTLVKDYEAMFIPMGNMKLTIPTVPLQDPTNWIQYLENFFYQAVGIPKIILGGSEQFTEATSKVGYLTFEQVYMTEQKELENDIRNKLFLDVKFIRPVSIKDEMLSSEAKNTGQVGFQPNEMTPTVRRNE